MPPPILKYLIIFNDNDGYGWTESHWKQASGDVPNLGTQLGAFVTQIVPRRAALLPKDCAVVGARVSYPRSNAIASLANREAQPGPATWDSLPANVSLALQMQSANGTSKKIIHMRGLPTVISHEGEYINDGAWKAALDEYVLNGLIAGGLGWYTKDPVTSCKGDVTTYTVSADPRVTFTVAPKLGALPAIGSRIQVRFSGLNSGRSALNKTLLCSVVSPTSLRTIDQVAAGPFIAEGKFNYRAVSFVGYAEQGSKSLGERRPGRPLNRLPGRSAARPLA